MPPQLLERRAALTTLRAAVDAALGGAGSVAVLTGEAGIGKTSVVRQLLAEVDPAVRVLSGDCDDLIAPAPLAPLREAVANLGGPLTAALAAPHLSTAPSAAAGAYPLVAVLPAMLAELSPDPRGPPGAAAAPRWPASRSTLPQGRAGRRRSSAAAGSTGRPTCPSIVAATRWYAEVAGRGGRTSSGSTAPPCSPGTISSREIAARTPATDRSIGPSDGRTTNTTSLGGVKIGLVCTSRGLVPRAAFSRSCCGGNRTHRCPCTAPTTSFRS
ncbi:AAA family ATPase [Micromonospora sp. NPDC005553]|uniref:ATP-binding protein n=1 Tax=Micromonospora sp. NPDC005553 TaxID=3364232 RepID=UPI003698B3AD